MPSTRRPGTNGSTEVASSPVGCLHGGKKISVAFEEDVAAAAGWLYVVPLDERLARASGTLCARAGMADVIDASVVVLAQLVAGAIVSSEAGDLRRLLEAAGASIDIHEV